MLLAHPGMLALAGRGCGRPTCSKRDLAVYKAVLGTGQQASDFPNFSSFTTTSNAQTLSVGANTACSGKGSFAFYS